MNSIKILREHPFTNLEFDWLAHDLDDNVAFFSSAGMGPVPDLCIALEKQLERIHQRLVAQSNTTRIDLLEAGDRYVHDWTEIASRGYFSYDWNRRADRYIVVAAPAVPMKLGDIDDVTVRGLAVAVGLRVQFSKREPLVLGDSSFF